MAGGGEAGGDRLVTNISMNIGEYISRIMFVDMCVKPRNFSARNALSFPPSRFVYIRAARLEQECGQKTARAPTSRVSIFRTAVASNGGSNAKCNRYQFLRLLVRAINCFPRLSFDLKLP